MTANVLAVLELARIPYTGISQMGSIFMIDGRPIQQFVNSVKLTVRNVWIHFFLF
jgi:hypothetical protein